MLSEAVGKAVKARATAPHVIVEARAGTGKTTTMVEGLRFWKGLPVSIEPSPQQAAVWEELARSPKASSVTFVAFNKAIADELARRVPAGVDARTMHSLGFKAVMRAFGRVKVDGDRVSSILSAILEAPLREIHRDCPGLVGEVTRMVSLVKTSLAHRDPVGNEIPIDDPDWAEVIGELAAEQGIELEWGQRVVSLVPQVLARCKDIGKDRTVDFDDMVWLPVALNLPVDKADVLIVDESQDLNRVQQELARRAGRRLILVGDPRQAIYGFAGADAESMRRMQAILEVDPAGCVVLPLTVTRRCGKAIVAEAQRIVPDFEAHESNPEGQILHASFDEGPNDYREIVRSGDMVLCRVNAPLVSECFRFIRAGRKATIRGRDIGAGLIRTLDSLKPDTVEDLAQKVDEYRGREIAKESRKANPSEARMIAIDDRCDCLIAFTENAVSVAQVRQRIEDMFADKADGGVVFSSIHRAKGLEADRVFFLRPKSAPCPHPMAKTPAAYEQEVNLVYVAVTRAISVLVHVSGGKDK